MQTTPARRGRQPDANSKSGQIRELLKTGMTPSEIAKKLNCTPALIYNVRARLEGAPKRGPGRPPKAKAAATNPSADGLGSILEMVKQTDRERTQLRVALQKIQSLVAEALS